MNKKYFIIGGSQLQLSFIKTVKEEGFESHVFDYDKNCPGAREGDFFYNISIKEKEKILEIGKNINPLAVHTVATEQGNLTACYVSEKLNLFSNSYQTALNTTNKVYMKSICKDYNIPTPGYQKFSDINTIKNLNFKFPVIVKPSDRSAGRGVSLAINKSELVSKSIEAMDYSYDGNVLIEDYLDFEQYSLETITFNGRHKLVSVCKMTFDGPPNFVEYCHHLPASLNKELLNKMEKFIEHTLNSFSIICGASHIEVRVNKKEEIILIEIASRMGGWRDWMIKSAIKYDYCKAILYSSLNKDFKEETPTLSKVSIAKTIISKSDYIEYEKLRSKNPEIIVKDLVLGSKSNENANNLIECDGPYVICVTKEGARKILE